MLCVLHGQTDRPFLFGRQLECMWVQWQWQRKQLNYMTPNKNAVFSHIIRSQKRYVFEGHLPDHIALYQQTGASLVTTIFV
jgi:hypothetical protein